MTMNPANPVPYSDHDFEQLSAYIDGALTVDERRALELRMADDSALRAELDALTVTVRILREDPPLRAPRDFVLTRAQAGLDETATVTRFPGRIWSAAGMVAAIVVVVFGVTILIRQTDDAAPAVDLNVTSVAQARRIEQEEPANASTSSADNADAAALTDDNVSNRIIEPNATPTVAPADITADDSVTTPSPRGGLFSGDAAATDEPEQQIDAVTMAEEAAPLTPYEDEAAAYTAPAGSDIPPPIVLPLATPSQSSPSAGVGGAAPPATADRSGDDTAGTSSEDAAAADSMMAPDEPAAADTSMADTADDSADDAGSADSSASEQGFSADTAASSTDQDADTDARSNRRDDITDALQRLLDFIRRLLGS